ncbi:MAG: ComEC/Rec2 family competence protein, partial [Candidatus Adiutrix sp.]
FLAIASTSIMLLMPIMEKMANFFGPGLMLPAPSWWFILAYYLAAYILLSPIQLSKKIKWAVRVLFIGLILNWAYFNHFDGELKFTVLDVGQGSSIHINFPTGEQMLIDGGGSFNFDPGEAIITPYLLRQGLRRLDVVALTHPDMDHLKGLLYIVEHFKPKQIWAAPWPSKSHLYRSFEKLGAASQKPSLESLYEGVHLGPVKMEIIWPPKDYEWARTEGQNPTKAETSWVNNYGLVFRLTYGEHSFLITGDIEKETELALAQKFKHLLKTTVLVAPHHGSRNSLSDEFLKATEAQWVVFAAGRNNAFGLPHPQTVLKAKNSGAQVWRTDLEGAFVFKVRQVKGQLEVTPP